MHEGHVHGCHVHMCTNAICTCARMPYAHVHEGHMHASHGPMSHTKAMCTSATRTNFTHECRANASDPLGCRVPHASQSQPHASQSQPHASHGCHAKCNTHMTHPHDSCLTCMYPWGRYNARYTLRDTPCGLLHRPLQQSQGISKNLEGSATGSQAISKNLEGSHRFSRGLKGSDVRRSLLPPRG